MINPTKSRLLKQNTRTKEAGIAFIGCGISIAQVVSNQYSEGHFDLNACIGGVIMDNTPNDFMSIPRIVKPDTRTVIEGSVVVNEPHPARSGSDFQPARFPTCIVALPVVVAPFAILQGEVINPTHRKTNFTNFI